MFDVQHAYLGAVFPGVWLTAAAGHELPPHHAQALAQILY